MGKITHGASYERGYNNWRHVIDRCYNPKSNVYEYYGARGIQMDVELKEDFFEFIKEIGVKPEEGAYSVGRIDNSKGYVRGNIRWETPRQQAKNRRIRSDNDSGVAGVRLSTQSRNGKEYTYWSVSYVSAKGKQTTKTFSIERHGLEKAKQMAIEFKQNVDDLSYGE